MTLSVMLLGKKGSWVRLLCKNGCIKKLKKPLGLRLTSLVRCIAKVADSNKLDKKTKVSFKPLGAISYDSLILCYKWGKGRVSIWRLKGRQDIAYTTGAREAELLKTQEGESALALMRAKLFLFSICEVERSIPDEVEGVLGIDLGISNIATTCDGEKVFGKHLKNVRHCNRKLRAKLQGKDKVCQRQA